MLRFRRVARSSLFEGWTPGWILGALLYLAAILALFYLGRSSETDLTPCPLFQVTGFPCPLCGGTTASLHLFSGRIGSALLVNPLVAILVAVSLVWFVLILAFGIRVEPKGARSLAFCTFLVLLLLNWVYVAITQTAPES